MQAHGPMLETKAHAEGPGPAPIPSTGIRPGPRSNGCSKDIARPTETYHDRSDAMSQSGARRNFKIGGFSADVECGLANVFTGWRGWGKKICFVLFWTPFCLSSLPNALAIHSDLMF